MMIRSKRVSRRRLGGVLLLLLAGLLLPAARALAQSAAPTVVIEWPNEGETLYAGPSSLLYSIPLAGRVQGLSAQADAAQVRLEILQAGRLIMSQTEPLSADGHFSFLATVNPTGSDGDFPAEHLTCSYDCHLPGTFALPAGEVTLRVLALGPGGDELAVAERDIVVDRSDLATVPVRVVLAEDPGQTVPGVRVASASWLYMWRARHEMGLSDASGLATMRVEALAEAPTEITFRALPTIVDGVLYQGADAVSLTLPPGASASETLELRVTAQRGAIAGVVEAPGAELPRELPLHIVSSPTGRVIAQPMAENGRFNVTPLPLDRYVVLFDDAALRAAGLYGRPQAVDLTTMPEASITLTAFAATGGTARGTVVDAGSGRSLPYAWVATEAGTDFTATDPIDGAYLFSRLAPERLTLVASAPGYYSRAESVDLGPGSASVQFRLSPQPETRFLPWGNGTVVLPAAGSIEETAQGLRLERGWLWGFGGNEPLSIRVGATTIAVAEGAFSLELLPGQRAWLVVREGRATVSRGGEPPIVVRANEMVNLLDGDMLQPVAQDAGIIAAITPLRGAPLSPVWQPTLAARLRDGLARIGVGAAQAVTFVTYGAVVLLAGGGPLILLWLWRRQAGARTSFR